jgi:hypothetical protein
MKSKSISASLPIETFDHLKAMANDRGVGHSVFARQIIEAALGEIPKQSVSKRRIRPIKKVTIGVDAEILTGLEREAKSEGVAVSTWAASILAARYREAPQPVKRERHLIQKAFFQLVGVGRNLNQMTYAMSRGILMGEAREPTRQEIASLRKEMQEIREDLRCYASGRYDFQTTFQQKR